MEDLTLSLKLELEQSKEEREYEKKKADTLSSDLVMLQTKAQNLTRDLHKAEKEV